MRRAIIAAAIAGPLLLGAVPVGAEPSVTPTPYVTASSLAPLGATPRPPKTGTGRHVEPEAVNWRQMALLGVLGAALLGALTSRARP